IYLNGNLVHIPKRAIVLVFDDQNWSTPKTVNVQAVDDQRDEGDRIVAISHTVLSDDKTFDHALVRNVEGTIHDNDPAGILLTQLDPYSAGGLPKYNSFPSDNNTVVLEGDALTGVGDVYAIELQKQPTGNVTVAINPTDNRVYLTSTDAMGRFHEDT